MKWERNMIILIPIISLDLQGTALEMKKKEPIFTRKTQLQEK
jgi:hypothetical protein